ncbi:hypothetical protein ASF47_17770 [Nocardioides sp. Leaf285]|nr:hypothetical protein ASF47_17770 [Nocardioides sp. Leaf285]
MVPGVTAPLGSFPALGSRRRLATVAVALPAAMATLLPLAGCAATTQQGPGEIGSATTVSATVSADQAGARPAAGPARPDVEPLARAAKFTGRYSEAVSALRRGAEVRDGYEREEFTHWVDADSDGCDTREEVLAAESLGGSTASAGPGCDVTGATWHSYYDDQTFTDSSDLDIDHTVALAESWDSGARAWDDQTRERFANDLGEPRSLIAVSASSNRSKSDQDPSEWMPEHQQCRYLRDWVTVKVRWSLSVDRAERAFLRDSLTSCPDKKITVRRARIVKDAAGTGGGTGGGTAGGNASGAVKVASVVYDPPGSDDESNLNAEVVALRNPSSAAVKMGGWILSDAADHTFTFPTFTLAAGSVVRIHSGSGKATDTDLFASYGHVWNNSGDTVTLTRSGGSIADSVSYPGGGSGRVDY